MSISFLSVCVLCQRYDLGGKVGESSLLKPTPRKKPDSHERQNYYNFMYIMIDDD